MKERILNPRLNIANGLLTLIISISVTLLAIYRLDVLFTSAIFILILILAYDCKDLALRKILLVSYFIRVFLIIWHFYFFPLPGSDQDAIGFENISWDIVQYWDNRYASPYVLWGSSNIYSYIGAAIYYFIGRFEPVLVLINTGLSIIALRCIYKIAEFYNVSRRTTIITVVCFSFFPTFLLYSVLNLREMFVSTLATISFYYFLKWTREGKVSYFCLASIFIIGSSSFHGGMFFAFLVYCFIFCLYNPKTKNINIFSKRIILGTIIGGTFFSLYSKYLSNKLPENMSISFLQTLNVNAAQSRAAYLVGYYPSSLFDFFIQTPVRVFYFLFTPFPWNYSGLTDAVGIIDSMLYYLLIPFVIKGLTNLRKTNKLMFWTALLLLVVLICSFSWGVSNYGTAIRHRAKLLWLFMPLAMYGLSLSKWKYFFLKLFMIKKNTHMN